MAAHCHTVVVRTRVKVGSHWAAVDKAKHKPDKGGVSVGHGKMDEVRDIVPLIGSSHLTTSALFSSIILNASERIEWFLVVAILKSQHLLCMHPKSLMSRNYWHGMIDYRSLIEAYSNFSHIIKHNIYIYLTPSHALAQGKVRLLNTCLLRLSVWTAPRHRFWCCKTGVAVTDGPNIKVCKACPHGIAFLNSTLSEDFFPFALRLLTWLPLVLKIFLCKFKEIKEVNLVNNWTYTQCYVGPKKAGSWWSGSTLRRSRGGQGAVEASER